MAVVAIEHLEIGPDGVARVIGKRTKVIQIVMDKIANGWTPEEIAAQYPHLSLAEIHAALAYYYDHQRELDLQIRDDLRQADALRQQAGDSPVVQRLRAAGLVP
jgi:uncharacterized protein (DUF433 family)